MPVTFARIARDLIRLLGANVFTRALGIAALVVYAQLLAARELAALPVFFILGSFVTVPFNFGLFPALMREVPLLLEHDRAAALGMIRAVMQTVAAGVLITGVAYVLLAPWIADLFFRNGESAWLVRYMTLGAITRGLDDIMTFILRSTREFRILAHKKLAAEVTTPIAAVVLTYLLGVRGLIIGVTLGVLAGLAWAVYGARDYLFVRAEPLPILPIARRSRPYYLEAGLFFVTQQGDQALVGALLSPTALAGYYIARRIPDALGLILLAVEEVMGPTLARATLDGPEGLRRIFQGFTLAVAAFVLPAATLAVCLATAYTNLVGRGSYADLAPAVALLALGLIAQGAITVVSQAALALGRPRDRLKITMSFASLLLLFTAGSAQLGLTAVALGRSAALIIAALVGSCFSRALLPPFPWPGISKLALPTAALAGTTIGLQALSQNLWLVPAHVSVAVGVFLVTLYVVLGPTDRAQVAAVWEGRT